MADNFDLMATALKAVCPNNEILLDNAGKPSVMVRIPKMTYAQLGMGESTALFPAFIINGQEVDEIYISKYLNIVQNGRAYSLPGVDPAASMNFDQARSYCEAKGDGWHCMTRMEWGLLMRICEMQGFIPLGNNNYGKHSSEQFYKAIPTFIDTGAGGKTGRTATGTGPLTWYHDNSPSGIADLVGDEWEWAGGVRTVYGELQVMANNNGADAANSQGTSSTKWMAISADDGSYITPDGSGTTANSVKLDIVSGHIQWSKTITTRNKDSDWPSCSFAAITCDSTISDAAKLVLQCLGMLPYKSTDLCAKAGHQCWFRKRYQDCVLEYTNLLEDNLIDAVNRLQWHEYQTGPLHQFYEYYPKKRIISSLPFYDRVVNCAAYNVTWPIYSKSFYEHSYGTLFYSIAVVMLSITSLSVSAASFRLSHASSARSYFSLPWRFSGILSRYSSSS